MLRFLKKTPNAVSRNVWLFRQAPRAQRPALLKMAKFLLSQKKFEGLGGLKLPSDKKLMVAAQAALLVIHRNQEPFPNLESILIYPSSYLAPSEIFLGTGPVAPHLEVLEEREGESWREGSIVLAWDSIWAGCKNKDRGLNVVLHEFAHQLEPELDRCPSAAQPILREYKAHKRAVAQGKRTTLDSYGAESPSEFFAVSTEMFFMTPSKILRKYPRLYAALAQFYQQDPANWSSQKHSKS